MQIDHRPPDTIGAKALADARKTFGVGFGYAGLLSMFIGLLSLTVPLFTMQLYDRVMASQSLDTLTMLGLLAAIGLLLYGALDFIRALTFQSIASMMLRGLNPVALRAAVASSATQGAAHASQALRDLHEIRSFLTGGAIATPLDAAWTPLYFVVLFALHPMYGLIGVLSVALMVATGLASDVLTRRALHGPAAHLSKRSRKWRAACGMPRRLNQWACCRRWPGAGPISRICPSTFSTPRRCAAAPWRASPGSRGRECRS